MVLFCTFFWYLLKLRTHCVTTAPTTSNHTCEYAFSCSVFFVNTFVGGFSVCFVLFCFLAKQKLHLNRTRVALALAETALLCATFMFLSVFCSTRLTNKCYNKHVYPLTIEEWARVMCEWSLYSVLFPRRAEGCESNYRCLWKRAAECRLKIPSDFYVLGCLLWFNGHGCGEWHQWWACVTNLTHCVAHHS